MRLRESEVCKALELFEDALACGRVNASLFHAGHQVPLQGFHALRAAFGPHRATQLIGTCSRQARCVRRDTHELLLKEGHTEGLAQSGLKERVQIGDLLTSRAAPQIGID